MTKLITEVSALMEDIEQNSEGFDKKVLFEAVNATDFSDPVSGDDLIAQLRKEGLL
jgi:hypothetical protein